MSNSLLRTYYRLLRRVIRLVAKPDLSGVENLDPHLEETGRAATNTSEQAASTKREIIYVLDKRSIADLLVLEHALAQTPTSPLPSPLAPLTIADWSLNGRAFALNRTWGGKVTMQRYSRRLLQLVGSEDAIQKQIALVPVSIFWGRSLAPRGSWIESLTSDQRPATGGIKRFLALLFNRGDIHLCIGKSIPLEEIAKHDKGQNYAIRRSARLLRVRFKRQHEATLGPDFSHRRTLLESIANSPRITEYINETVGADTSPKKHVEKRKAKLKALAYRHAKTIASDMSYSTIRLFLVFLGWFWRRIYTGVNVRGLNPLKDATDTHTLVYVPSHRSHIDYLVLSYTLYRAGIMIPHIAAGDNLNMPMLGGFLRRGGAFFMRRSFKDDPLYGAVFDEYLYQVYNSGHCVEFFPEGGRSRTGRLLPAKYGLLKLSLAHQLQGLKKPLAFVPVYFGYEKVIEGGSYMDELRGANKKAESVLDLINGLKVIRQNFGQLQVNIGEPIKLDDWLQKQEAQSTLAPDQQNTNAAPNSETNININTDTATGININDQDDQLIKALGAEIMGNINAQATVNSVNLVALASLSIDQEVMEEKQIAGQSDCYMQVLQALYGSQIFTNPEMTGQSSIEKVAALGLITRTRENFGAVLHHAPFTALLMTWYRNNVLHLMALPSLMASLLVHRQQQTSVTALHEQVALIFPFIAHELSITSPSPIELAVAALAAFNDQGMINVQDEQITLPDKRSEQYMQLEILANLMSETLGRMYLVLDFAKHGSKDRQALSLASEHSAEKISLLLGINGPEFFDQKLIGNFLDQLIEKNLLHGSKEATLQPHRSFIQLHDAISSAIDTKLKFAIDAE
jgi:glycerol-3-phosphate O-acyltransferase